MIFGVVVNFAMNTHPFTTFLNLKKMSNSLSSTAHFVSLSEALGFSEVLA